MRTVLFDAFGDPASVLKVVERERPVPQKGQALVRMVLSPIHNHDLMIIAGQYGFKPELPAVPGTEAVGVVEAVGEGVETVRPGQRVAGGGAAMWADYYLADASGLVPVPEAVDDATACQMVAMPLSAKMILADLGVKAGDWIVQNAGNGAVGKLVSRFGAEQGINVLSLVRRDAAVDELQALGVANVVSTESAGWQERVRETTNGAPLIRGLDSLSGDGASQLLEILADGGELINFGAMTQKPLSVTPAQLLFRGITVRGFWAARGTLGRERIGAMMGELMGLAAKGELRLPIEASFGLDEVAAAVRASGEAGRKGKIALRGPGG